MTRPSAKQVAKCAGYCTVGLSVGSFGSCAASGSDGGPGLDAVLIGFVLLLLALASLIVWLTARDIAGDAGTASDRPGGVDDPR